MGLAKNVVIVIVLFFVFIPFIDAAILKSDYDIDQLLVRINLKEGELIEKGIKIINTGLNDTDIDIKAESLESTVSLDNNHIKLRNNSSEDINLRIKGAKQGVFIGKIIFNSTKETKEVPVLIEVESKNVFVDGSINQAIPTKTYPNSKFPVDISLINLIGLDPVKVQVYYEIMDFDNNKIYYENEEISIRGRASFIKIFKLPDNIETKSYILIVKIVYKESLGITTYIFDIEKKVRSKFFIQVFMSIFLIFALFIIILKALSKKNIINPRKMERIATKRAKMQEKLNSLVEAYKSGFISRKSYKKSTKKLIRNAKQLNNDDK